MSDVDISRERLELLHSMGCADYIHLALRAALDAAEARERQAVEAERERCAKIADPWVGDTVSANVSRKYIAAAIRTGAKP